MKRMISRLSQPLVSGVRTFKISPVEAFFLSSLLIFGSVMVFLTPLGGGYDEDQHLIRTWQMSDFVMIPRDMGARKANFPQIFFDLSYRRQPLVEPIQRDFWEEYAETRLFDRGYYYGTVSTRSIYSPALLFPQAMAMRYLGRKYDLPLLVVYYGCRFADLLSYMILAWLALRLMPYSKWLFMLLAMAPAAIYQASTISADSISNGIGFLFIAGCLAVHEREEINWREVAFLVLLIALLFTSKLNLVPLALLPFVLIGPRRYKNAYAYVLLIVLSIVLFIIEVVGWSMLAGSGVRLIASDGISFSGQLQHILSNPFLFLQVILNTLSFYGRTYIIQWIGAYGYDYGNVPSLTYVFFFLGVVLALAQDAKGKKPDARTRMILAAFFLLAFLSTISLFYFTITAVGEQFAYGVQGRYFTPVAPLLLLPLSGLIAFRKFALPASFQMVIYALPPVVYIAGLFFSFHVVCGSTYHHKGLCYQPFYKNYSPLLRSTAPVSDGVTLIQEIVPACDGLTLVQVRINSVTADANGRTEFIVRDEDRDLTLADGIVENGELPEDAWYVVEFPPDWNSAGRLYTLTVRGMGGEMQNGPLLAYSLKPEYPYGVLYENGSASQDDLIFQYGCITGLEKILR